MSYPVWYCGIPTKIPKKPFCDWLSMFNTFPSMCAVIFCTTHGQNVTGGFDTEGLLTVSSLCVIVGSLSWFIKCLIGKTGKMGWVVYIHAKCMYSYETHTFTIIECEIVRNVHHVTSTWLWISWWSGDSNVRRTPCTERPSWNSLEVNFIPSSVCICSKSHYSNLSNFPNLDWKMSILSMTYSVVKFSVP